MENDEVYTMEVGRCLLVRINDDGGDDDFNEDNDCRRVSSIWQALFWHATCINSFHPPSNLQNKQYCYPHFIDEGMATC